MKITMSHLEAAHQAMTAFFAAVRPTDIVSYLDWLNNEFDGIGQVEYVADDKYFIEGHENQQLNTDEIAKWLCGEQYLGGVEGEDLIRLIEEAESTAKPNGLLGGKLTYLGDSLFELECKTYTVHSGMDDIRLSTEWDSLPCSEVEFIFDQYFIDALKEIHAVFSNMPMLKSMITDLPGYDLTYISEDGEKKIRFNDINDGDSESTWVDEKFVVSRNSKTRLYLRFYSKYADDELIIDVSLPESLL